MENLSAFVERTVSDVAATPVFDERERARSLVQEIAGHCWRGRGDMVDRVYDAICRAFPRRAQWTRRRIRAFWNREAAIVSWREIREMEFVAEVERAERLNTEHRKAEHNEFIRHIGATLDRLAATDAEFHQAHRAALRELAVGSPHQTLRHAAGEGAPAATVGGGGDAR